MTVILILIALLLLWRAGVFAIKLLVGLFIVCLALSFFQILPIGCQYHAFQSKRQQH
jgi:hypothetical protein